MKIYECTHCGGPVTPSCILDECERGQWWNQCENCSHFYGRPVIEKDLEYLGDLETLDPGLREYKGDYDVKRAA